MKKTAILIPTLNSQEKLKKTIKSICYKKEILILIIDDGSNPKIEIETEENKKKIKIIRNKKNIGIEKSLEIGVDYLIKEKYDYILRIDAGDIAINNRIEKQILFMEEHPKVGIAGSFVIAIDENTGEELYKITPPTDDEEIRKFLFRKTCYIHPSWIIRTKAIEDAGNYSKNYKAAEDLDLLIRIKKKYEIRNIPEYLLKCEMSTNGISAKKRKAQLISTIRLQLKEKKIDKTGAARNIIRLMLPYKLTLKIKSIMEKIKK